MFQPETKAQRSHATNPASHSYPSWLRQWSPDSHFRLVPLRKGLGHELGALPTVSEQSMALRDPPKHNVGRPFLQVSVPTVHFQKPGADQLHKEVAGRPCSLCY